MNALDGADYHADAWGMSGPGGRTAQVPVLAGRIKVPGGHRRLDGDHVIYRRGLPGHASPGAGPGTAGTIQLPRGTPAAGR